MAGNPSYWLLKSEPEVFSIQDLKDCRVTGWDGVRNFQARNYLRDSIKVGDGVLFYHSNTSPSGISGLAEVVKEGYPDDTAFDPNDAHYDPRSRPDHPTWYRVDVKFVKAFPSVIPLQTLRKTPGLKNMLLFRNGRLSVQPVAKKEWEIILRLAEKTRNPKAPKPKFPR
ncbi:MAG TPA: EVE domain-containing protein [Nitrospiria bacterium]|jgi:predicted RNA-binding protein with PUA-like domain|nr:EVE domain-containing protein [Nitrospiria bacterium]